MKILISILLSLFFILNSFAQDRKTVQLSQKEIEYIFLNQNLELIAEKMNISISDATVSQAKLWNNPTLSISDLSFWSTRSERDHEKEIIPPLFGSFGKNTQFSIELSQMIETAGKRSKRIEMEKTSKNISIQQFEELLNELKNELRKSIHEIKYIQSYIELLKEQTDYLTKLIDAYQKQLELNNIAQAEVIRLKAALLEIENERNQKHIEMNNLQKNLKIWLNAEYDVIIYITELEDIINPSLLLINHLISTAKKNRPDLLELKEQKKYYEKNMAYEKAQRVPDLNLSISYDRWGGVWRDFLGIGVSIDLPILNRNQGNIKVAEIIFDQTDYRLRQQENKILNEILESYDNYKLSFDFYKRIENDILLQKLDSTLDIYLRNFLNRNISIIEYLDFLEAYKTNKEIQLNAIKEMHTRFDELQYITGTEINSNL